MDIKPLKLSFHVPATEHHVADLLGLVCDVVGTTPSRWVYGAVIEKLQKAGLIDASHQPIAAAMKELNAAMPPNAAKKKPKTKKRKSHAD